MAWERKLIGTDRVRNSQKIGVLGKLLTAIAEAGGHAGSLVLLTETSQNVVRDITIMAEDEAHLRAILEAMRNNKGTRVLEVRDEVLELHQKGKIAIRSRYPINSLATLHGCTHRRGRSLPMIAKDPSKARLYTSISHMVAIVSDGTAVLGLGDIDRWPVCL